MAERTVTRAELSEAVYEEVGAVRATNPPNLWRPCWTRSPRRWSAATSSRSPRSAVSRSARRGERVGRNPKTGEEVPIPPPPGPGVPRQPRAARPHQRRPDAPRGCGLTVSEMSDTEARGRGARKSAAAYRTISEVSEALDVPQHVLRFWETKFTQVRPLKRGGGRRYYRPEDIQLSAEDPEAAVRGRLHDQGRPAAAARGQGRRRPGRPPSRRAADLFGEGGRPAGGDADHGEAEVDAAARGHRAGSCAGPCADPGRPVGRGPAAHRPRRPALATCRTARPVAVAPDIRAELQDLLAELKALRAELRGE